MADTLANGATAVSTMPTNVVTFVVAVELAFVVSELLRWLVCLQLN